MPFYRPHVLLFLVLSLSLALPAAASNDNGYGGGTDGASAGGAGAGGEGGGSTSGLSTRATAAVTRTLKRDFMRCQKLTEVYRFDCYRIVYRLSARKLVGNQAYRPARQVLESVEKSIDKVVRTYADPTAPRKRAGFQAYRAIKPAAVSQAKRDVTKVLAEAETTLLRSAGKDNSHFASIAQAVNSNKVLLRSALLEIFRPVLALLD
ncbi:hypothetical protein [Aquicoccus sp. SU-CL01552]|uniref:hypothetical protein n=1 Tax=Aquicoccus sp. SU-CL01552 TaxID=3127656 RepID=UPI0031061CB1